MREHRKNLARFVAGKRVLNLFSYTGALSVASAKFGAATVTSVDTSTGVNAWAASNFARSGLVDAKKYTFETGDASRYLVRAAKDKERYDVILCDPPSSSSAAGVSWALGRDYPDLIAKCAAVVPPDGLMWLAANTHELGSLAKLVHKGLRIGESHRHHPRARRATAGVSDARRAAGRSLPAGDSRASSLGVARTRAAPHLHHS